MDTKHKPYIIRQSVDTPKTTDKTREITEQERLALLKLSGSTSRVIRETSSRVDGLVRIETRQMSFSYESLDDWTVKVTAEWPLAESFDQQDANQKWEGRVFIPGILYQNQPTANIRALFIWAWSVWAATATGLARQWIAWWPNWWYVICEPTDSILEQDNLHRTTTADPLTVGAGKWKTLAEDILKVNPKADVRLVWGMIYNSETGEIDEEALTVMMKDMDVVIEWVEATIPALHIAIHRVAKRLKKKVINTPPIGGLWVQIFDYSREDQRSFDDFLKFAVKKDKDIFESTDPKNRPLQDMYTQAAFLALVAPNYEDIDPLINWDSFVGPDWEFLTRNTWQAPASMASGFATWIINSWFNKEAELTYFPKWVFFNIDKPFDITKYELTEEMFLKAYEYYKGKFRYIGEKMAEIKSRSGEQGWDQ